ncbi:MAG: (2Fe-2S)-binding protein [Gammaproteobacteria bacterium]
MQAPTGEVVTVNVEGNDVQVPVGDTVAAVVLAMDLVPTRTSAVSGAPRAPLCMMGVCFECLMEIDGIPNQQACQIQVAEGMRIRRQYGVGDPAA